MKKSMYLNEKEVESRIGNEFARAGVSFAGWNILDTEIKANGKEAETVLINKDMKIEMIIQTYISCMTLFYTRNKNTRKREVFGSLREALINAQQQTSK